MFTKDLLYWYQECISFIFFSNTCEAYSRNIYIPAMMKQKNNYIVTLLGKRSFVSRISPGVNHLSMSRPLCWSFSVVQLLELYSAYFGRYSKNVLSLTALQMYHWHLQMIYYKLDILLQMVSYEVMTIENENGQLQSADNCK